MKWLHSLGSVGAIALAFLSPSISGLVAAHPAVSITLGAIYAILGQFVPHSNGPGNPQA